MTYYYDDYDYSYYPLATRSRGGAGPVRYPAGAASEEEMWNARAQAWARADARRY